jgi:predicted Zn-dependent protease with MMP-like domain
MPQVSKEAFHLMVLASIDGLPSWTRESLDCIEFVIDDEPPAGEPSEMMGSYQGTPLPEREHDEGCTDEDTITLFAGPIEREAHARGAELLQVVAEVLHHEVSHYLGISDDELRSMGRY